MVEHGLNDLTAIRGFQPCHIYETAREITAYQYRTAISCSILPMVPDFIQGPPNVKKLPGALCLGESQPAGMYSGRREAGTVCVPS